MKRKNTKDKQRFIARMISAFSEHKTAKNEGVDLLPLKTFLNGTAVKRMRCIKAGKK